MPKLRESWLDRIIYMGVWLLVTFHISKMLGQGIANE